MNLNIFLALYMSVIFFTFLCAQRLISALLGVTYLCVNKRFVFIISSYTVSQTKVSGMDFCN